jgi:hypothetical protein
MTLTVRPRGQLLPVDGDEPAIEVTAVTWSEKDAGVDAWGGIIEAEERSAMLREQIAAGGARYRLRLADGREGVVELGLSEFEADGSRPIVFRSAGALVRTGKMAEA